MNKSLLKTLSLVLAFVIVTPALRAADASDEVPAASAAHADPDSQWSKDPDWSRSKDDDDDDDDDANETPAPTARHHHHHGERQIVSLFHNSHLEAGGKAESVVSIFGSASSDGEADEVVSVFGNTRVSGEVHDTAVAVLGNVTIDGAVHGDAVAVLGNVTLGPHAVIDGDVNAVAGRVIRDPASVVHGDENGVYLGVENFEWLHAWLRECLGKGRPLAFSQDLTWAWTLALGLLGLYALLALLFRDGVTACVQTLEREPGHSALAAFLMVLLTPVLLALLCVTVVGIAAVPFVLAALLGLSLFGKTVILAWLGQRAVAGRVTKPALAVLIGGAIALLLYTVPIVGFVVYKLLGFFGVGAVAYTLILKQRARQAARADRLHATPPAAPAASAAAASVASAAATGETPVSPTGAVAGAAAAAAFGAGATQSPPPGAAPEPLATYPRAGFWIRIVALLIDAVLVGFLLSFGHGYGHWHGEHHLHLLVLAVYGAIMWKLRGSTLGGLALDLRVVRVDGRPMQWETAIVRALGCFLSLFVVGLGFIWIAIDPQHQAWHDKIAGTLVVRVPKGTPLP